MCCCRHLVFLAVLCLMATLAKSNRFAKLERPYAIKCNQPKPRMCSKDFVPHCLKGRKQPVFGHCEFQDAVCDENAEYDPSFQCKIH